MQLRTYRDDDFDRVLALTIEVFGPSKESFRDQLGDTVFTHQHGNWRDDYRDELAGLTAEDSDAQLVVAETRDQIVGFSAWQVTRQRRHGDIEFVAVKHDHRRQGVGRALCEYVFDAMRSDGVEVVELGTGGDTFHAPARALYERLGMNPLPVTVYFKEL